MSRAAISSRDGGAWRRVSKNLDHLIVTHFRGEIQRGLIPVGSGVDVCSGHDQRLCRLWLAEEGRTV